MKTPLWVLLLCLICSIANGQSNKLELLDIFNYEYVSDPQISPDGSKVVYIRNSKDVMSDRNLSNVWLCNYDGSEQRPLTSGHNNAFSPRWSPDGEKIVFVTNTEDNKMKIFIHIIKTNHQFSLTNTNKTPSQLTWSNDGSHLAFTMFVPKSKQSLVKMPAKPEGAKWNSPPIYIDDLNYRSDGSGYLKPGNRQIFTLPIDGGTPRQLTFGAHNHGAPQWAKGDKEIFFSADLYDDHPSEPGNSEIHKLNLSTLEISTLTDRFGPDGSPMISPDGELIAYVGLDDKFQGYQLNRLYVMNRDGSGKREIKSNLDRNIYSIKWDGEGGGLYFLYDDQGDTKIGHLTLEGNLTTITGNLGGLSLGRPYNAASYSVSQNNKFAFTHGTTEHPAELAVHESNITDILTKVNEDLFSYKKIGKVEEMWWESSFDKQKIQGWLVTPPDFDPSKKYPLILEIHGGPFASYGSVYSAEIQAFAAAGYVVLYSNPRGSSSYGEAFGNSIHHDYPNHDYEDLMSGVDAAIAKGFVDDKRLFVTGGSGGGVLTAWIVGKTERFRAAVVAKPVINWYSFVLYADSPSFFSKYWFPNKPWEDPSSYIKRSPLSYVGNVTTPTMLLTGEEDYRTPIAESEQYYTALHLEKVETAMVRIPGASHGIASRPSNLVAKIVSILAWFEKYDI